MAIVTIRGQRGGAGLNYAVKAYANELLLPDAGKTNEIAVITSTPIGVYSIASSAPTTRPDGTALQSGDVWLANGTVSTFAFNALQKNGLYVYGKAAYQYDGSAWQTVTAKIWYDGAWLDWRSYLYDYGNECSAASGGWTGTVTGSPASFVKNSDSMRITIGAGGNPHYIWLATNSLVDLSGFSTLKARIYKNGLTNTSYVRARFGIGASGSDNAKAVLDFRALTGDQVLSLDVSSLVNGYITFYAYNETSGSSGYIDVFEVWGE